MSPIYEMFQWCHGGSKIGFDSRKSSNRSLTINLNGFAFLRYFWREEKRMPNSMFGKWLKVVTVNRAFVRAFRSFWLSSITLTVKTILVSYIRDINDDI